MSWCYLIVVPNEKTKKKLYAWWIGYWALLNQFETFIFLGFDLSHVKHKELYFFRSRVTVLGAGHLKLMPQGGMKGVDITSDLNSILQRGVLYVPTWFVMIHSWILFVLPKNSIVKQ